MANDTTIRNGPEGGSVKVWDKWEWLSLLDEEG